MDYVREALGGLHPQSDEAAALRLILEVVVRDGRFDAVSRVLRGELGGLEGDPGWVLERRIDAAGKDRFLASVDPHCYSLKWPHYECDGVEFRRDLAAVLTVFEKRHPDRATEVWALQALLRPSV